ncbi:hypothetical protein OKC48_06800 [Methylorubrum extorquens]|uniref:hypothetical protein n=1 Tax=Methylorubrum extorquens TaxID=408 RepID=UPI002237C07E|nr:hypothetical protein [Methylorubrum extorquens]UYW28223.1 hypothetical protein OKC48_06800 [Methylorubrum extorquens]
MVQIVETTTHEDGTTKVRTAAAGERRPWMLMRAALEKGLADGLAGAVLADAIYMDLVQRGVMPWWNHEGEEGALVAVLPLAPRVHTVIVNGQAIEVPRRDGDDVLGVAERAVALASYGLLSTRPWEIKDAEGERLGAKDDPDRIRHISLPAGVAS